MKGLFYIIIFVSLFCSFSNKRLKDKTIYQILTKHSWKVFYVTDKMDGGTRNYFEGFEPVKGSPAHIRSLGDFDVLIKFKIDSVYMECKACVYDSAEYFNRKWSVKKGVLKIKFDNAKNNYSDKPVLYGDLKIITCTDSILIVRRQILKDWVRTFKLHKI